MEELSFENRYAMTKERYIDWSNNPIKKNRFIIIWLVLMIFTFFMFINSILNKDIIFASFYALLTAFCIYRGFLRSKILLTKRFKVLAINQGATEWERVIQLADCITIIDGNTTTQYQWSQVTELVNDRNYLILVFKNGLGVRLDRNGFTKGTYDIFLQYIKNTHKDISVSI